MFMVVGFPWPTQSAYAQLKARASAIDALVRHDALCAREARPELATAGRSH
jgi:hypothetical protein